MEQNIEKLVNDEDIILPYTAGALLYCPANNEKIADAIINEKYGKLYSLALCLEDSISDKAVESAECILIQTIIRIYQAFLQKQFYLPKIFIRVRFPRQICSIYEKLGTSSDILTGFIVPKFSAENSKSYIDKIIKVNAMSTKKVYMMPIIESMDIVNPESRYSSLSAIKRDMLDIKKYILNVRVGGNDICKSFGIRRHIDETIYDIGCVSNILSDIITYFSMDYVISGPVWEYFNSENDEWKTGLQRELKLDKINGFTGKTVIHPKQIEVVNNAMKIDANDYDDALSILKLFNNNKVYVEKSVAGERMNECKTHLVWAKKVIILSKIYGVNENAAEDRNKILCY